MLYYLHVMYRKGYNLSNLYLLKWMIKQNWSRWPPIFFTFYCMEHPYASLIKKSLTLNKRLIVCNALFDKKAKLGRNHWNWIKYTSYTTYKMDDKKNWSRWPPIFFTFYCMGHPCASLITKSLTLKKWIILCNELFNKKAKLVKITENV